MTMTDTELDAAASFFFPPGTFPTSGLTQRVLALEDAARSIPVQKLGTVSQVNTDGTIHVDVPALDPNGDQIVGTMQNVRLVGADTPGIGSTVRLLDSGKGQVIYLGTVRASGTFGGLMGSVANTVTAFTTLDQYAGGSGWLVRQVGGTVDAPAATPTGALLGIYGFGGHGDTIFSFGFPGLYGYNAEAGPWTDAAQGTYLSIFTTPIGNINAHERWRILDQGDLVGGDLPNLKANQLGIAIVTVNGSADITSFGGSYLFTQADVGKQVHIGNAPTPIQFGTYIAAVSSDGVTATMTRPAVADSALALVNLSPFYAVDNFSVRTDSIYIGHSSYIAQGSPDNTPEQATPHLMVLDEVWDDDVSSTQQGLVRGPRGTYQTEGGRVLGPHFPPSDAIGGPLYNISVQYSGIDVGVDVSPGAVLSAMTDSSTFAGNIVGKDFSMYQQSSYWTNKLFDAFNGGSISVGEVTDYLTYDILQRTPSGVLGAGISASLGRWTGFMGVVPHVNGHAPLAPVTLSRAISFEAGSPRQRIATVTTTNGNATVVASTATFSRDDIGASIPSLRPGDYSNAVTYVTNDYVYSLGGIFKSIAGSVGHAPGFQVSNAFWTFICLAPNHLFIKDVTDATHAVLSIKMPGTFVGTLYFNDSFMEPIGGYAWSVTSVYNTGDRAQANGVSCVCLVDFTVGGISPETGFNANWSVDFPVPRTAGLRTAAPIVRTTFGYQDMDGGLTAIDLVGGAIHVNMSADVTITAVPAIDTTNVMDDAEFIVTNISPTFTLTVPPGGALRDLVVLGPYQSVTFRYRAGVFGGLDVISSSGSPSQSTSSAQWAKVNLLGLRTALDNHENAPCKIAVIADSLEDLSGSFDEFAAELSARYPATNPGGPHMYAGLAANFLFQPWTINGTLGHAQLTDGRGASGHLATLGAGDILAAGTIGIAIDEYSDRVRIHYLPNTGTFSVKIDGVTAVGGDGTSATSINTAANARNITRTVVTPTAAPGTDLQIVSPSTTVASGSNGVNLNTFLGAGVLNVVSTADFAASGSMTIVTGDPISPVVTYTGKTGTTFTGCTTFGAFSSVLATGDVVNPTTTFTSDMVDSIISHPNLPANTRITRVIDTNNAVVDRIQTASGSGTATISRPSWTSGPLTAGQHAVTVTGVTGTVKIDGIYHYNGNYDSGVQVHMLAHTGWNTGDYLDLSGITASTRPTPHVTGGPFTDTLQYLVDQNFHCVILATGTNDTSAAIYQADMQQLLAVARFSLPNASTCIWVPEPKYAHQWMTALPSAATGIAGTTTAVADMNRVAYDHSDTTAQRSNAPDQPFALTSDGVHYVQSGARLASQLLLDVLDGTPRNDATFGGSTFKADRMIAPQGFLIAPGIGVAGIYPGGSAFLNGVTSFTDMKALNGFLISSTLFGFNGTGDALFHNLVTTGSAVTALNGFLIASSLFGFNGTGDALFHNLALTGTFTGTGIFTTDGVYNQPTSLLGDFGVKLVTNTAALGPTLTLARVRTTGGVLAQGDVLGGLMFRSASNAGGTTYVNTAEIRGVAEQVSSTTQSGGRIELNTTPNGSITLALAAIIDNAKSFHVAPTLDGTTFLTNASKFAVKGSDGSVWVVPSAYSAGGQPTAAAVQLSGFGALTTGFVLSTHATAGIGYATGSGGTVTQATSRTTGVTLNKINGQITTFTTTLGAGANNVFTLTNSAIAATDTVVVSVAGAGSAGVYSVSVNGVAAGSCAIVLRNIGAAITASEAPVINFAVVKAVNA